MALAFMVNRLKALALLLIGILKRALCCFRRRRRASCDPIPLTTVGIVSNDVNAPEEKLSVDLQSWTSWDENPISVVTEKSQQNNVIQQKIELYRQQTRRKSSEDEENEAPLDFFEDMTPCITRQMKVFLKDEKDDISPWNDSVSSHLSLQMDPVLFSSPDLGTWEDSPGWEDQTQEEWDPDTILKEKRHLERQRRLAEQQQKRQEREQLRMSRPLSLGAKLS